MKLTEKQRRILEAVAADEGVSVRRLADRLEKPGFRTERFSYDEVYGQLRALAAKGLVERTRRQWSATPEAVVILGDDPVRA